MLKLNEAETLRFGSDLIHHDGHTFDCSDFAKIFFEIIFCDDAFVEAGNKYFLDYITGNIALKKKKGKQIIKIILGLRLIFTANQSQLLSKV